MPQPQNHNFGSCRPQSLQFFLPECCRMRTPYVPHVTNDVDDEYKFYYGLAESSYKERFRNHNNLFNHRRYQNETELSKNIWTLKHQNKTPTIKCKIVQVVNGKVKLNWNSVNCV